MRKTPKIKSMSNHGTRLRGTDLCGEVYNIALTTYSDSKKYHDNYDKIKWDKDDGDTDEGMGVDTDK